MSTIDILLPWDIIPDPPEPQPDIPLTPTEEVEDDSKIMWHAMEKYHNMGLSMMWGRIDADPAKDKAAKSPIVTTWSSEIERRFTLDELAKVMTRQDPNLRIGPIIICGKGSGNLIVIDLDTKHWPGIDVLYYTAVRETYPELWKRLRRHKTMSDGRHILYRTIEEVIFDRKNPGLAKKKGAKQFGIESRTHGGYVMAPPGAGYTVEYDVDIPTISIEDHERLFQLARLLNEEIPVAKKSYTAKTYESSYDLNPFEDFNSSPAAETVLQDNGWTFDYENSQWVHYTRPDKAKGVSASWHKTKRFYHIFTSSTDLIGTNFSPAHLRCHYECNGDWKKLYVILAKEGYGKHKAGYEEKYVRKAVETGKPLPANFSKYAQESLVQAVTIKNEKYPHGIFWEYNPTNDSYSIQRQKLQEFMHNLGLRLHKGEPCIIEAPFIRKLKEDKNENGASDVYNVIKSWIREEDEAVYYKINHEFIKFWQSAGSFSVKNLEKLDNSLILRSKAGITYKAFKNGVLTIKPSENHELQSWSNLSGLVWADSVSDREFKYIPWEEQKKSMYVDFSGKAIKSAPDYVKLVVGYLCCGYKVSSESYVIALLEAMVSSKGGGTGKGFWAIILNEWLPVLVTNGESIKKDIDQIIQNWTGQPVVHINDLPRWVNLSVMKNIASDNSQRKLLYKNIENISVEDMPKFILSSQWGIDAVTDGGVMGRIRMLAFTDYFDRTVRSIRKEYGGDCPEIWDNEERVKLNGGSYDYDGFFSYVADAIQAYQNVREIPMIDDYMLWEKSWDMRFSGGEDYLREWIDDNIESWGFQGEMAIKAIRDSYNNLCDDLKIPPRGRIFGDKKLHQAIQEYGDRTGKYVYEHGMRGKIDGVRTRIVKIKITEFWEREVKREREDEDGEANVDEKLPF